MSAGGGGGAGGATACGGVIVTRLFLSDFKIGTGLMHREAPSESAENHSSLWSEPRRAFWGDTFSTTMTQWHWNFGTLADAPCDPPFSSQSAHTCISKSRAWQTLTGTHSEGKSHDFFQFQRKRMAARLAPFRINKPAKFKHEGSVLDVSLLLVNNICMFLMNRLQKRRRPWSNMQDCEGRLTSRFKPLSHVC